MEDDSKLFEKPSRNVADTPGTMLDTLRDHPEWSEREQDVFLGRIVERFPVDTLMDAVLERLVDLSGAEAEALLRLVEANATPERLIALGHALEDQPGLAVERAWEALSLLEENGLLNDFPTLFQRWEELEETLDDEGSVDQLIEQIEDDREGLWMALQGLNSVEPEIRPRIIRSLAERPLGPGLVEFLRLLVYATDKPTREAAFEVLQSASSAIPAVQDAWLDLSKHHQDEAVVSAANLRLKIRPSSNASVLAVIPTPGIVRSAISAIDGRGMAVIVLRSRQGSKNAVASFLCQIEAGVIEVVGNLLDGDEAAESCFDDFVAEIDRETVLDVHPLALRLLAGVLLLNGPQSPPSLRFWLESTTGADLRPQAFSASFADWDPSEARLDDMAERVEAVLDACPGWVDDSALTYELAEEILLREKNPTPDPRRDAGAYRFLFEHRIKNELESYRRRLLWMAWFWKASNREELGRSALALAWQLSDAQHIVPGHPFHLAITSRSLSAAQEKLKQGLDPRSSSGRS